MPAYIKVASVKKTCHSPTTPGGYGTVYLCHNFVTVQVDRFTVSEEFDHFVAQSFEGWSFLHMLKDNHEVNHGILACDWPIAWLTQWLNLTMCRKDRPLVKNHTALIMIELLTKKPTNWRGHYRHDCGLSIVSS